MSILRLSQPARALTQESAPVLPHFHVGLEKESLRVNQANHRISSQTHPRGLGSALTHPSITTDFSEALIELITHTWTDFESCLNELNSLHRMVHHQIAQEEYLWCASMPPIIEDEDDIPIAHYGRSNLGQLKTIYRRGLKHRYGSLMQTIAGIHFNLSFPEPFWSAWQACMAPDNGLREVKDRAYFACIRNYVRTSWLTNLLFGSSNHVDPSYITGLNQKRQIDAFYQGSCLHATSLRLSDIGYINNTQQHLSINLDSLEAYLRTLQDAMLTPAKAYQSITDLTGIPQQINANTLQIENEYYGLIRPKQITQRLENPSEALHERGVAYLEVRALDLHPFEPLGITQQQMAFMALHLTHCLLSDSPEITSSEQQQLRSNHRTSCCDGHDHQANISMNDIQIPLQEAAHTLLDEMAATAQWLDKQQTTQQFTQALNEAQITLEHPEHTPAKQLSRSMQTHNQTFLERIAELSQQHQARFLENPLSFEEQTMLEATAQESWQKQEVLEQTDTQNLTDFLIQFNDNLKKNRSHIQ